MQTIICKRVIPSLIAIVFSGGAMAAGFQLQNQNAAGTAVAFAGAAAVAEDASTIFFNPAGMTYLPQGHSISVGGTVIDRSVKFSNTGTTPAPVANQPLGDNGGDGGGASLVPALYYSYAISPELRFGLGLSVTYGSETKYGDNFIGRFSGRYTSIHQINLNPSLAYQVNDLLSVGVGINYAQSEIEFRQNAPVVGAPLGILKGDDTAWGWNVGAMLQLSPETRLGLAYRSKLRFHLEGSQTIAAIGIDRPITAQLETPDNFSLALSQKVGSRLELLADATWTGWSSVNALEPVVTTTGARATAPLRYNFRNTWRYGLGAKYQWNDTLNLRAGIAYDQTPVPEDAYRTMTVPDADRTWLAFGARWQMNKATSLDFGYAHIFFQDVSTSRAVMTTAETTTLQTVRGNFKTSANLYSMQLNYNF